MNKKRTLTAHRRGRRSAHEIISALKFPHSREDIPETGRKCQAFLGLSQPSTTIAAHPQQFPWRPLDARIQGWPRRRFVVGTWHAARGQDDSFTQAKVRDALLALGAFWEEQARIVQLLVERVEIAEDGLDIRLRTDGLAGLVREFGVDARGAA